MNFKLYAIAPNNMYTIILRQGFYCILTLAVIYFGGRYLLTGSNDGSGLFRSPEALAKYYVSGQYLEDVSTILHRAEHYLDEQISEHGATGGLPLAIVLDIDETALSTFSLQTTSNNTVEPFPQA